MQATIGIYVLAGLNVSSSQFVRFLIRFLRRILFKVIKKIPVETLVAVMVYALVTLLAIFICYWVANCLLKTSAKSFALACAVIGTQLVFMSLDIAFGNGGATSQVVLLAGGVIWLAMQPGLCPVFLLTIHQVSRFVIQLKQFLSPPPLIEIPGLVAPQVDRLALLVFMCLYFSAVVLLFRGLKNVRRDRVSS